MSAASNTSSTKTVIVSGFWIRVSFGEKHWKCTYFKLPCPNILLSNLFLNTLSLRYSLNVSEQVSPPYKTTGKIIFLYILIFIFLVGNMEDKVYCTEWQPAFLDLNFLLISSWMEYWFVRVVTKYLNGCTLTKDILSVFILWFCPAFWYRDVTMCLVLSAFTSRPVSLLATTKASVFFFICVCFCPVY